MPTKHLVITARTSTSSVWGWLRSYGPSLIVGASFALLAARLFRLISLYAVNVFFFDQWDIDDATLFEKHSLWQMFAWQHGPHRQGVGALFARLVEPCFRWNSRTESFVVGGVIVAATLAALYLKQRLFGRLSLSDVTIPALLLMPAQYETLFVTANFAHGPFPLLLIVLYCIAWTVPNRAARYALVLASNFLTIYTGFGLLLGVLTPGLLLIDCWASPREERLPAGYFAGVVALSLLSFGSFFLGYRFDPAVDCFNPQPRSPGDYVAYMAFMFSHFFALKGLGSAEWAVGVAALLALVASMLVAAWSLIRRRNADDSRARRMIPLIVTALTAYCLLFCASTAYGRLCAGLETARASRYVIYLELGVLGVYFHVLGIRHAWVRRVLLAGLLAATFLASSYVDQSDLGYFPAIKLQWKRCYFMTEDVNLCNQAAGFPIHPNPEKANLQKKLAFLKQTRQNLYTDAK
jgi:hypothetical protein